MTRRPEPRLPDPGRDPEPDLRFDETISLVLSTAVVIAGTALLVAVIDSGIARALVSLLGTSVAIVLVLVLDAPRDESHR